MKHYVKKNYPEALASTSSESVIHSSSFTDINILKPEDIGKNFQVDTGETGLSYFYNHNFFREVNNLRKIAELAHLELNENEIINFSKQLTKVLVYVEKLKEVNTKDVETTSQVTGLENVTREDKTSPSLTQEEALSNTRSKHNGLFKVRAILEA